MTNSSTSSSLFLAEVRDRALEVYAQEHGISIVEAKKRVSREGYPEALTVTAGEKNGLVLRCGDTKQRYHMKGDGYLVPESEAIDFGDTIDCKEEVVEIRLTFTRRRKQETDVYDPGKYAQAEGSYKWMHRQDDVSTAQLQRVLEGGERETVVEF